MRHLYHMDCAGMQKLQFFLSLSPNSPDKSLPIDREGMKSLLSPLELLQYNWIVSGLHI